MLFCLSPVPCFVSFATEIDFDIDQPTIESLFDSKINQQICISKIEFLKSCDSFVSSRINEFDNIFPTGVPFKDESAENTSAVSVSCADPGRRRSRNSMMREAVKVEV